MITSFLQISLYFLICLITVFLLWKNWTKQKFRRLPPGPPSLPIIGSLLKIDLNKPYDTYRKISETYGSVFTVWLGDKPVVVVSGLEALRNAFLNLGEEFSGRETYPLLMHVTGGYGLLVNSGETWKQLRRFTVTTFKNFGMGRQIIENRIQEEAKNLVEALSQFRERMFNPKEMADKAVFNVVCSILFGRTFEYCDPQLNFFCDVIELYFKFLCSIQGQFYNIFPTLFKFLPGKHRKVLESVEIFKCYIRNQADMWRKNLDTEFPRNYIEAFMGHMIKEKDNPNTEFHLKNLEASAWNLLSAGTETTASTLRQSLLLMIKYPEVQERVYKEIVEVIGTSRIPSFQDRLKMPYTDAVIHEILRFTDISPTGVPHKVLKDVEFKGYYIPEGTVVIPLLSSALSDPKLWKNPNVFDPENFLDENGCFKKNEAFLAFGLGKRSCLGEGLARMELFIFFTALLQKFTFSGTQPVEDIDTSPEFACFGRLPRTYTCYAKHHP
ncbi:cytochrome P450 2M1-like [Scleropages formosus]|uniref:cytochrome P450 2M1-like n=1 Tax=Scleropages formosus TaxID=113540 RepID=UPI0008786603|nr:cytochrome P450 2M1-like [Scleropages formosus]